MRVMVNEPLIANRSTWGRRIMSLGFVALLFAVLLSLNRQTVLGAYGVMLVGLITINIGVFIGGKWMRDPRADQLLDKALKGLNHGSRLYNYLLPVDHVILSPPGLFVLTLKFQDGQITGQGEKWRRRLNLWGSFRALFEPPLGNPGRQARKETAKVQSWLDAHLPDAEVPVQPVIVFANPKAQLQLEEPSVPAVALADLKGYLRAALKEKSLPQATLQALTDLCDEQPA
jgi:hypothetical protein